MIVATFLRKLFLLRRGTEMTCKCGSDRILFVSGKVSDMCFMQQGEVEHNGYVVSGLRVGCGDYLEFDVCLDCGQLGISSFTITSSTRC